MSICILSFDVVPSDPLKPLGFECWLDQTKIIDIECVGQDFSINHAFSDDDAKHTLKWVLKNKTHNHTQLDKNNQIVADSVIAVKNIAIDNNELVEAQLCQAIYCHDHNGTSQPVQQRWYGTLGCNGTASLTFDCPVYLWILSNS